MTVIFLSRLPAPFSLDVRRHFKKTLGPTVAFLIYQAAGLSFQCFFVFVFFGVLRADDSKKQCHCSPILVKLSPVLWRDYFLDFYIWCPLAGAPKPLVDLRVTGEQMAALVGKVTASQCQLYRGQSDIV